MPLCAKKPSRRLLFILFILLLPIFVLLRWDSSTWLSAQVNQAAKQAGYTISYDKLALSGLGISFEQLNISKDPAATLQCDTLEIGLSFTQLFSGTLAADITAIWQGNPINFTVSRDKELIQIRHIHGQIEAQQAAAMQSNLPAKLSGLISIEGDTAFNQATQQLQHVNLKINWADAMAGLTRPEFNLGDYLLALKSNDDENLPWDWIITGGQEVVLTGHGSLSPQHAAPKLWALQGEITVDVSQATPSLTMMFQTMLGGKQANIRLSGPISKPKIEVIY